MARIFFLCFLLLAFAGEARATSCLWPENVMKDYPVVFKGTALSTETLEEKLKPEDLAKKKEMGEEAWLGWAGKPQVTTFRIVEGYKGPVVGGFGTEVKIFHRSPSVFGASYTQNETYVIFAKKDGQGRFETHEFCNPSAKAGTIDTNGEHFAQLKIYNHQAEYLRKLVAAHPDNPYFYLEEATLHEKYDELELAEQDYKTGLLKMTGKSLPDALSATDPKAAPFIAGYNRVHSPPLKR